MVNPIDERIASYKLHNKGTFKKKNMRYEDIITQSFNFIYAGLVHIFITYNKHTKKYIVVYSGFTYDGETAFFSHNRFMRRQFDTMYEAIVSFHNGINLFTQSMDWYTKDYFDSLEFYNYADEELFR